VLTLSHEKPDNPGVTNPAETNAWILPLKELEVAVTTAEPAETAVSRPVLEIVAIAGGVALQVALAVTSLVELSV
jgi:hypothetical protein